ncbi:hypothetical protein BV20DRAFT_208789 [Pilatotrama ljubarskyi]|nr:hypothetical protein BV20DRAFT_208789 [Pilatotrama ljubarskyi]
MSGHARVHWSCNAYLRVCPMYADLGGVGLSIGSNPKMRVRKPQFADHAARKVSENRHEYSNSLSHVPRTGRVPIDIIVRAFRNKQTRQPQTRFRIVALDHRRVLDNTRIWCARIPDAVTATPTTKTLPTIEVHIAKTGGLNSRRADVAAGVW